MRRHVGRNAGAKRERLSKPGRSRGTYWSSRGAWKRCCGKNSGPFETERRLRESHQLSQRRRKDQQPKTSRGKNVSSVEERVADGEPEVKKSRGKHRT